MERSEDAEFLNTFLGRLSYVRFRLLPMVQRLATLSAIFFFVFGAYYWLNLMRVLGGDLSTYAFALLISGFLSMGLPLLQLVASLTRNRVGMILSAGLLGMLFASVLYYWNTGSWFLFFVRLGVLLQAVIVVGALVAQTKPQDLDPALSH